MAYELALNKLGPVCRIEQLVCFEYPVAASQKFNPNGASFVYLDANGHITLALTATQYLFGWAFSPRQLEGTALSNGYWTSSAVAGTSKLLVAPAACNPGVLFRVPALTNSAVAARCGECTDLVSVNDGTVQYANLGTNDHDVLLVMALPPDGDDDSILVAFNPNEVQRDT